MSLISMQDEYRDKYNTLGKEEHEELVREHKENINGTKHAARPSPHALVQDFSNTVRNIIMLVHDAM